MLKPLRGTLVIALEQAVAAPLCTARLADDGARVIKIERKGGGDFARKYDSFANGQSSYFTWLNRGKESVELDIKADEDLQLLRRMIAKADVVVQNLAPGATTRAGLDSAALRELNPKLVTLDITGYGLHGPKKDYKAYDLLVGAEAGLCAVTGSPDAPGRVGVSICDILTGINGYGAVMRGLLHRQLQGQGCGMHVSLFDSAAEVMNVPYLQTKYTGEAPKRLGLKHPSIAPYGVYTTRDKQQLLISIQNEPEWVRLMSDEVLSAPFLALDPRFKTAHARVTNRVELDAIIGDLFSQQDGAELEAALLEAKIAFGQLRSVQGLVDHPQLRTTVYETEGGLIEVVAPAIMDVNSVLQGSGMPSNETMTVPSLGQHTESVRSEFS